MNNCSLSERLFPPGDRLQMKHLFFCATLAGVEAASRNPRTARPRDVGVLKGRWITPPVHRPANLRCLAGARDGRD